MRKRTILAALTVVMMLFTLIPATVSAKQMDPAGEEYLEYLELTYKESIKDRSKYCDDVWTEIQEVYLEGRQCYSELDDFEEYLMVPDYETMLMGLGKLTWVKSKDDLALVKQRYINEINEEYKTHSKAEYTEYSWDLIQDYLYVGKKAINNATTFREAAMGYSEAMLGMEYATTKEELKEYREMYIDELSIIVNLYLDPDDYSEPIWQQIQDEYNAGVTAIKKAELEYELDNLLDECTEKICNLSGLTYPLDYNEIDAIVKGIMAPALEFYEEMDTVDYIEERIEEAEEILWDLEEEFYEVEKRADAEKLVNAALKKMKALPNREYDESFYKTYVVKAKATGVSGTSVKVTWNAHKDLDGYIVYRATSKNGNYKAVWYTYNGKRGYYVDKKLTYGKNYFYKVKGIKDIDWNERYTKLSKPVKGTPKLMAPAVKLSKTGKKSVMLKWAKVPGADGYQIYRSNSINGQFKLVKTIKKGGTVQWKDTTTVKGKTYCYKMRSYDIQKNGKRKFSGYGAIKTIKR